jgi:hypothetical protein
MLALDDDNLPDHAHFWDNFKEALKTMFGKPDPAATTLYKLDQLSMKDTHHVTKYNIKFNELATITSYEEHTLFAMYYCSLAPCIKDTLAISSKPDNLNDLCTKAQALDSCYWEHSDKDHYKLNTPSSSSTKSTINTLPTNAHSSPCQNSTPSSSCSCQTMPMPKSNNLSKVLGPDGKLLPTKKEHCCKNNLCLLCTSKDHMVDTCPSCHNHTQAYAITTKGPKPSPEAKPSDCPN